MTASGRMCVCCIKHHTILWKGLNTYGFLVSLGESSIGLPRIRRQGGVAAFTYPVLGFHSADKNGILPKKGSFLRNIICFWDWGLALAGPLTCTKDTQPCMCTNLLLPNMVPIVMGVSAAPHTLSWAPKPPPEAFMPINLLNSYNLCQVHRFYCIILFKIYY